MVIDFPLEHVGNENHYQEHYAGNEADDVIAFSEIVDRQEA
jgi:hypothetical protein